MYTLLSILYVILVVVLILIILLQEPRESGMSPALGGMQQILGVRGVPTFFTRLTWGLGAVFMVLSLILATINPSRGLIRERKIEKEAPVEKSKPVEPQQEPEIPGQGR